MNARQPIARTWRSKCLSNTSLYQAPSSAAVYKRQCPTICVSLLLRQQWPSMALLRIKIRSSLASISRCGVPAVANSGRRLPCLPALTALPVLNAPEAAVLFCSAPDSRKGLFLFMKFAPPSQPAGITALMKPTMIPERRDSQWLSAASPDCRLDGMFGPDQGHAPVDPVRIKSASAFDPGLSNAPAHVCLALQPG